MRLLLRSKWTDDVVADVAIRPERIGSAADLAQHLFVSFAGDVVEARNVDGDGDRDALALQTSAADPHSRRELTAARSVAQVAGLDLAAVALDRLELRLKVVALDQHLSQSCL